MKNRLLLILAVLALSCSKSSVHLPSGEEGVVTRLKFACGASCDAAAWALKMTGERWYEPIDLPEDFRVENLPVRLTYKTTGLRSAPGEGTGEEKIYVLTISKR
ncbi:MAG TPA: hypothetical protein PK339_15575 [Flavitalea sp.]|nr:hypothetical protein [Flavitalea sp.]